MKHSTRAKLEKIFDGESPVTGTDRIWALSTVGWTQRELASVLGLSRPVVHRAIHNVESNSNVATKLSEITGLTLKRLWPCGRYANFPAKRKRARLKQAA